jgi:glycerate dehydrogenase
MKIVDLDGYAVNPGDLNWDILREFGELTVYDRSADDQIIERAKDADAILINKVNITAELLSQLPKLKYIGELATGYNNIDIDAARARKIVVSNIPAYSTDSVAQLVFAHILNVMNRVDYYVEQNRRGRWTQNPDFCYWDEPFHELSGKTIGIVGLGNIGSKVAHIALDFGMDVFAYTSKDSSVLPNGIQKTTLKGILAVSDILTLHCPLTDAVREFINKDNLAKMKSGAILVNTGRGALVNEKDVADALHSGQLGAYCADVMVSEPPSKDNPLFQEPHAFITPHLAWATVEARQRLMHICAENIRAYMEGHPINVVNQ